MISDYNLDMLC